ncbi:hypothetical protein [Streptosporangium subroseum]|uniref:hypothetical protein n=1 Tax=Streptosporangium subroseum TaxID=106412 RepID=UPI00308AE11F|nr:hypothetical protein OHB15_08835 [Streptosporangium subroseum]
MVASAGWALTTERVTKKSEALDLAGLLDVIGERLKVLEDYPTPPGCTSPFAPI